MRTNLYKSFFYGMLIFFNLLLVTVLYASPMPVNDDTPSKPREESPDFIMDQSGSSTSDDSHYADEWEKQGGRSLSRVTESSSSAPAEKKPEKPAVLKSDETVKPEALPNELKESEHPKNSENENLKNNDQDKKDSLDKTDPFEPQR